MDAGLVKLIELLLVFGAVLAFGFWQLRSVDRDRRARLAREAAQQEAEQQEAAQREALQPGGAGQPEAGQRKAGGQE
jgi:type II secretory pathway pseudopilin PulG